MRYDLFYDRVADTLQHAILTDHRQRGRTVPALSNNMHGIDFQYMHMSGLVNYCELWGGGVLEDTSRVYYAAKSNSITVPDLSYGIEDAELFNVISRTNVILRSLAEDLGLDFLRNSQDAISRVTWSQIPSVLQNLRAMGFSTDSRGFARYCVRARAEPQTDAGYVVTAGDGGVRYFASSNVFVGSYGIVSPPPRRRAEQLDIRPGEEE